MDLRFLLRATFTIQKFHRSRASGEGRGIRGSGQDHKMLLCQQHSECNVTRQPLYNAGYQASDVVPALVFLPGDPFNDTPRVLKGGNAPRCMVSMEERRIGTLGPGYKNGRKLENLAPT